MVAFRVVFLVCLTAFSGFSQSSSTITGQVTDKSGAAVANATIVVTAVQSRIEHKATTNEAGFYNFPALQPLDFTVSAVMPGFKQSVSQPFKLDTAATMRIDFVLLPADLLQSVEVTAAPPAIVTESSMVGTTVTQKEIDSLPLNGRNSLELALTVGGVMGDIGADEGGVFFSGPASIGAGLSIGGGRPSTSTFLADGANSTSVSAGRATVTFSPDTIQEFKVITSTFSARYGSTGGGVVSTVSRSGTNELHGSAYWYHRNPTIAARTFNSLLPPQLRRHEGGFTLGGPVLIPKLYNGRRKTFFFFSFEPKRWNDGTDVRVRLPTADERRGDFRNSWAASGQAVPLLYRQVQCFPSEADCKQLMPLNRSSNTALYPLFSENDPDPTKRGRVIPQQYLDPLAQKLLKLVPLPNMSPDSAGNNFVGNRGVSGADNRWNLKIDHALASADQLSVRYTNIPNTSQRYLLERNNYQLASFPGDSSVTRQAFLSETHTFGSRIVNEFRGGYTYSNYSSQASGDIATHNYTQDYGLPNSTGWGVPLFQIPGYVGAGLGLQSLTNLGRMIENQFQFADDLTMTFGRHVIQTGVDWRFQQMSSIGAGLGGACCGTYQMAGNPTRSGNASIPTGQGGDNLAGFLIGVPNTVSLQSAAIPYYYRFRMGSWYFQDDFKVTPRLTLNMGFRWQYNSPRSEKYNRQATLDIDHPVALKNAQGQPVGQTLEYVFAGFTGSKYLEPVHKGNFEPRFGFAWNPRKNLVLRGGYGISHAAMTGRWRDPIPDFGSGSGGSWGYTAWVGNTPQPLTQSANPQALVTIGRNPPVVNLDPIIFEIPKSGRLCVGCTPRDPRVPGARTDIQVSGADMIVFAKDNQAPYVQTWNLTSQIALPQGLVVSLTYMGQKGTHLYSPYYNMNNPDVASYQNLVLRGIDPNELIPDPIGRVDTRGNLLQVSRSDALRPFPGIGQIMMAGVTNSNSIYNAGTIEVERRFQSSLGFRFNYTRAKSLDDASLGNLDLRSAQNTISFIQDALDRKANRSVSTFDSKHRFNLTLTTELPFGRKHRLQGGRLVNSLISGWNWNTIGSLYAGAPMIPFLGHDNGIPGGFDRPQVIRPDIISGVPLINPRWNRSVAFDVPYFNPEAFSIPAFGSSGNAPRTLDKARLPWTTGLNTSVTRELRPFNHERRVLQLRFDLFNALNHATFNTGTGLRLFLSRPVAAAGQSLAGPIPYLVGKRATDFPVGSRDFVLAQAYNAAVGRLSAASQGRIIQLAVKLSW